MSSEKITLFLKDDRPEVRRAAVEFLADESIADAESYMVQAIGDPSDLVWKTACEALRARQPWLSLEPFKTRPVPAEVLETKWGKAWFRLRIAIKQWLSVASNRNIDILRRWVLLPGTLPDIIEELESIGGHAHVKELKDEVGRRSSRQILLVPTYQCNLGCSYCYAKDWSAQYGGEMKGEDIPKALGWCKDREIDLIILGGGEPTIYSQFKRLLDISRQNRMRVFLTSNTLYPKEVQDFILPESIGLFVSHYEQYYLNHDKERRKRYIDNIKAVQSRDIEVMIRYTLTERSRPNEWNRVLDFASLFSIQTISFGFAFRNFKDNNNFFSYFSKNSTEAFEQTFMTFVQDCRSHHLTPHLSKPIPLCAIPESSMKEFLLDGTLRSACTAYLRNYSQNLTINPDLSTLPCNAIGLKGPVITDFNTLKEAGDYSANFLNKLLFNPYFDKCKHCLFHYRGFCQSVCLAEHYAMMQDGNNR
jgi:MoaA/NifB/PqqE/SkfB family radical SAM enzyme